MGALAGQRPARPHFAKLIEQKDLKRCEYETSSDKDHSGAW